MTEEVPMVAEVDCSTGTVVERPMTAEEFANHKKLMADMEEQRLAANAEAAAKAEAKASAEEKLAKLGLTPEEIAALR